MRQTGKPHENVCAAIGGLEVKYRILDHAGFPVEIRSPADFAAALGYPLGRVAKTLFLCSQDRQAYAAAVCSVNRRLDFRSTARAVGLKRVQAASAEDLQARTGYPGNGVSPLGLAGDIAVVIDSVLFDYPTVLVGGGAVGVEIEISPADVARVAGAAVERITVGDS